jgi:hypothetical protein
MHRRWGSQNLFRVTFPCCLWIAARRLLLVRSTVAFRVKTDTVPRTTLKGFLLYVLAYLLWLVNVVVCIVAVIEFRLTINVLWITTRHSRWTLGLANQLSLLLGDLAAFVYVVFLESYYRQSVHSQRPKA